MRPWCGAFVDLVEELRRYLMGWDVKGKKDLIKVETGGLFLNWSSRRLPSKQRETRLHIFSSRLVINVVGEDSFVMSH